MGRLTTNEGGDMNAEEHKIITGGYDWTVDPAVETVVKALHGVLETEYARLNAQYDAADRADVQRERETTSDVEFDHEGEIDYWLGDLKRLIDKLDEFAVKPELPSVES